MAEYLSDPWFADVVATRPPGDDSLVVLQQVVTRPDRAEIRYHVSVGQGWAVIGRGQAERPDATFSSDWSTAVAVASGTLSTHDALAEGRIRVSGNLAVLGRHQTLLRQADPVPPSVRVTTTF